MNVIISMTRAYQIFYTVLGPIFPVLRRLFPDHVTTTVNVGRAMIQVAAAGGEKRILGSKDINFLAAAAGTQLSTPSVREGLP